MKAINYLFYLLCCLLLVACQDDDRPVLKESFVRFSLFLDNNGDPLVFPRQTNNGLEVTSYTLTKRDTLKLPVALSTTKELVPTTLQVEAFVNGIASDQIQFLPANQQLQFSASQYIDTLYVLPMQRFNNLGEAFIELELSQISNPTIQLGYPRSSNDLSTFTIYIQNTQPVNYQLEEVDFSIDGVQDEEFRFFIEFDQLVGYDEIASFDFFEAEFLNFVCDENPVAEFEFSLELQAYEGLSDKVEVLFTVLEDVGEFGSNLQLQIRQVASDNFTRSGNTTINFTKEATSVEERIGDPAANWYNVSNNFHRTFGRAWYFDETDGVCDWQSYQAFTRPVEVEPGSEFDNGQGFHRFLIGFRSIIANPNGVIVGTNPFNFRRYYDGASVLSPAYAINEALEFFPDPQQPNSGIIRVIPRNLQFIVDDDVVTIPMCGSGSYQFNDTLNAWEMFIRLICDETEINGNPSVEKQIFIYSENISGDPMLLDEPCSSYFEF